jgi:hypothetical protein
MKKNICGKYNADKIYLNSINININLHTYVGNEKKRSLTKDGNVYY